MSRSQLRPGAHSADQSGGSGEALPRYLQLVQEIDEWLNSRETTNAQAILAREERTRNERSTTGAMAPLGAAGVGQLRSETSRSQIPGAPASRHPANVGETRISGISEANGANGANGRVSGGTGGQGSRGAGPQSNSAPPAGMATAAAAGNSRVSVSGATAGGGSSRGRSSQSGGTQRQRSRTSRVVRIDRVGDGAMGDIYDTVQDQFTALNSITNGISVLSRSVAAPVMTMRSVPDVFASIRDATARLDEARRELALSQEPAAAQQRQVQMLQQELSMYELELQSMEAIMRQHQGGGGSGGSSFGSTGGA